MRQDFQQKKGELKEKGLRLFLSPALKTPVSVSGICVCAQKTPDGRDAADKAGQNAFILYKRARMAT